MKIEEVKKSDVRFLLGGTKFKAQWDWLIEQAEKAERLEMMYENTGSIMNRRHLMDKVERYEKALKFYANKEHYECDDETLNPSVSYIHIVDMDEGEEARKALGIDKD